MANTSKVKLNQIVALNAPKKASVKSFLTRYYQLMQKPAPFNGQERKYKPNDDNGEQFPEESQKVQLKVDDILKELKDAWVNMYDVVLTNDAGNSAAKADVIIDGTTILKQVPVSNLLWLEKQISDWKAIITAIPKLSLSDNWNFDSVSGLFQSDEIQTHKTAKVQEPIVLYQSTDKHPAQTQLITKDVTIGHWTTKKLSSAWPMTKVEELLTRLEKLRDAVLKAREEANITEIEQQKSGEQIVKYIFG